MRTFLVPLFALSFISSVAVRVNLDDEDSLNAAVARELAMRETDFHVNSAVEAFEDMSLDVDASGIPHCCFRDCCVGRPRRRDRCINRANVCHRGGGGVNIYNPQPVFNVFPSPSVIRNALSGRRLYAQAGQIHENGVGATNTGPVHDDQKWNIQGAGGGAYTITNMNSGRRLFAQGGTNWENGVGAFTGILHADQKWYIEVAHDGTYVIRNFHSGRRLYAQSSRSWGDGVGAANDGPVHADQKWFIDRAYHR